MNTKVVPRAPRVAEFVVAKGGLKIGVLAAPPQASVRALWLFLDGTLVVPSIILYPVCSAYQAVP